MYGKIKKEEVREKEIGMKKSNIDSRKEEERER